MFLYLFFILLFAGAHAECPRRVYLDVYAAVDLNSDGKYGLDEVNIFFGKCDENKDGNITIAELDREDPEVPPIFHGNARECFNLFDLDRDDVLSTIDIELNFKLIDIDLDGFWDRDEYKKRVDEYCDTQAAWIHQL